MISKTTVLHSILYRVIYRFNNFNIKINAIITAVIILLSVLSISLQGQTVKVEGRKILVNNQEYRINGICYNHDDASTYNQDIALLNEANINTIRSYSVITSIDELDAFAKAGIKIIMHLDDNNFESYVNTYKDHPAILMWEFGNECNYHPEWFGNDMSIWYKKLDACAARVHQLDPNHPVTSAHGEVPTVSVINACPNIDVWGINIYRWDNPTPAIDALALNTTKAMYLSEAGADSYNRLENIVREDQQAEAVSNIVNRVIEKYDLCAGICVFEFRDEWWKAGDNSVQNTGGGVPNNTGVPYDGCADEEYWGIVHKAGAKKPAFTILKEIYAKVSVTTDIL